MTNRPFGHTRRDESTHGRHRAHATFMRHNTDYCFPLHVSIAPAARINMPVSIPVRNGEDVRRGVCPTYVLYVRLSTCAEPSVACYWLQRAHGTTRGCVIQRRSRIVQTKDGQLASRRAARGREDQRVSHAGRANANRRARYKWRGYMAGGSADELL
ncbi:uncharacterized protein SCHCODRAFT_02311363 [Schizophyllum commune H4-8]|uniref:uncharacterized protein n=1 Tax=Schizophyllum commune (strain H4-8 / FGSC 9210) TaxID=578458 RepID=UPI0021608783|nr:uncharacterized protein SCHCODRAFT_02311363 [Schizophyllum commune H4-8]KAI5891154.1 hypothetical protein SCHCODRAFT_02311363 [Schizophyllum commune H4-8]